MKSLCLTTAALSALLTLSTLAFGQQDAPKVINGGVLNAKAVSLPKPEYPESAKATGVEGVVKVQVTIDENGNVESAQAVIEFIDNDVLATEKTDPRPALREAAEQAALEAKFSPTLLNGDPVKVTGIITYNFVLADGSKDSVKPIDGGILNGKAVKLPEPAYPGDAKVAGIVKVKVTVDESGNVISATAISGHPLLQAAAVAAALNAKFSPTFVDGPPIKVVGILTYNFVLPGKKP
jgi:TonB family protein